MRFYQSLKDINFPFLPSSPNYIQHLDYKSDFWVLVIYIIFIILFVSIIFICLGFIYLFIIYFYFTIYYMFNVFYHLLLFLWWDLCKTRFQVRLCFISTRGQQPQQNCRLSVSWLCKQACGHSCISPPGSIPSNWNPAVLLALCRDTSRTPGNTPAPAFLHSQPCEAASG